MKRIISVLAVMAIMAAMVAAMAAPALADKGGGGHFTTDRTCSETECNSTTSSTGESTKYGGKFTVTENQQLTDPYERTTVLNSRGGGKDFGGGNCTTTIFPDGTSTRDGNGSRCN